MRQSKIKRHVTSGRSGLSIIELLIACAITMITLLLTLSLVQAGIAKLTDMRIKAQIRQCARLTMEYFGSIPPDKVYAMSKSAPQSGSYDSGGGDEDLLAFVTDLDPVCQQLSSSSHPYGKKVQLRYTICPGCRTWKAVDSTFSTCVYHLAVRVNYNNLFYGGNDKHLEYDTEMYTGQSGDCDTAYNPDGCGAGSTPETKKLCTF